MIFNKISSWLWQGDIAKPVVSPPDACVCLSSQSPEFDTFLGMTLRPSGFGVSSKRLTTILKFCQEYKSYGVLIVCADGRAVSPAICVLVLNLLDGMPVEEASKHVKRMCPDATITDELRSSIKEATGLEIHFA